MVHLLGKRGEAKKNNLRPRRDTKDKGKEEFAKKGNAKRHVAG